MSTVQFAIGGDNVVGIRQPDKTLVPLAMQYSPEYIDTLAKVRNTPVVTAGGPVGAARRDRRRRRARGAGDDPQRQRRAWPATSTSTSEASPRPNTSIARSEYLRGKLTLPPGYSMEWTGLYQYAAGGALDAARGRPDHAGDHVRAADDGVPVARRQLADHAVGAVRAGRRHPAAVVSGLLDDDGGDHRLRVALRRRHPDRHHHDRVHPRGARAPHGRRSRTWMRSSKARWPGCGPS